MPTREQTPLLKYEKHAQKKSVGGGLKPIAADHEQHCNRARTAQLSAYFTQPRIDHRTIVRERRGHGTKFCGVELQQRQRAVATNGGMDGDWLEGQRPEARGPVVLRAAAAAVAGGNGCQQLCCTGDARREVWPRNCRRACLTSMHACWDRPIFLLDLTFILILTFLFERLYFDPEF